MTASTRGRRNRQRGQEGEREIVALLNEYGMDAERIYGQEEIGGAGGDVTSLAGNWEVKRRATLPAWLDPADAVRGVFVRRDRGPWLLLVRAGDVLDMLADRRDLLARSCQLCQQREAPGCCWLCAAASRIAAGEPEREVLADYGYARPTSGEGVGACSLCHGTRQQPRTVHDSNGCYTGVELVPCEVCK